MVKVGGLNVKPSARVAGGGLFKGKKTDTLNKYLNQEYGLMTPSLRLAFLQALGEIDESLYSINSVNKEQQAKLLNKIRFKGGMKMTNGNIASRMIQFARDLGESQNAFKALKNDRKLRNEFNNISTSARRSAAQLKALRKALTKIMKRLKIQKLKPLTLKEQKQELYNALNAVKKNYLTNTNNGKALNTNLKSNINSNMALNAFKAKLNRIKVPGAGPSLQQQKQNWYNGNNAALYKAVIEQNQEKKNETGKSIRNNTLNLDAFKNYLSIIANIKPSGPNVPGPNNGPTNNILRKLDELNRKI